MKEQKWLNCDVPDPMMDWLENRASDRKLRLFAAACCRNVWSLIAHPDARAAVEVSERFADGLATRKELASARTKALRAFKEFAASMRKMTNPRGFALANRRIVAIGAAKSACEENAHSASYGARTILVDEKRRKPDREKENSYQCQLLREIFGNPFRRRPFDPNWLTPSVKELANALYEKRRFNQMPLLGDALEEAGCDVQDVLEHCRKGGEHVRGCWVVDLILARQ